MATATKKVHTARSPARAVPEASTLAFLIDQDNGGDYHWELVDGSGEVLVHSRSFASQNDAERAARYVREGAHSALFEPQAASERQTVAV
jgi:uncharacterized protein YegP (UPF0339 family)